MTLVLLVIPALFIVMYLVGGRLLNAPGYSGPASEHFDGTHFKNSEPTVLPSLGMGIRYLFTTKPGHWDGWRELEPVEPPPARVGPRVLRVTFINHATTLVQFDGVNILTDPIWSERASPFSWAGPRRHHAPGIPFEDLPPIDLVLVSHNHYDHMNVPTLVSLATEHDPQFVTGLGNRAILGTHGIERVHELDWGDTFRFQSLSIAAQACRHFSGRGPSGRQRSLWVSFLVRGTGGSVYFAGDTSYGDHFKETARAHGPITLALLPIGAYEPRWFMGSVHLNPAEAVQAHDELGAFRSLAVHYGTFRLSEEGQDTPVRELRDALSNRGLTEDEFWILAPGEGRNVPMVEHP